MELNSTISDMRLSTTRYSAESSQNTQWFCRKMGEKKESQSLKILFSQEHLYYVPWQRTKETEKEGFEPSRRVNDLHP